MQPTHLSVATFALAALANLVTSPATEPPIPNSQRDVEVGQVSTSSTGFVLVPNTAVTIDNGSSARNVVVTFSAEAATEGNAGLDLGYDLDGAGCFKQAGPTAFQTGIIFETSTAVHVIPLGRGVHTIRACFRSNNGLAVFLRDRALIAEGRTK